MNNEPVAWGYISDDGGIYDCISPEEHDRAEGDYNIPLYTHPADLTDKEIWEVRNSIYPTGLLPAQFQLDFARAILRKAQEK